MNDLNYNDDQVKYFTRIREFKYERPGPGESRARIQPQSMFTFPLPVNLPNDAYQAVVREFELGALGASVEVIKKGTSSATFGEMVGLGAVGAIGGAGFVGMLQSLLKGNGAKIGDVAGLAALAEPVLGYGGAFFGYTRNPHVAMIFDRMGMRHFNLKFVLSPRNEEQSTRLNDMLTRIRNQMHPALFNEFVLEYPSMFSIEFVNLTGIGIPKIDYSFLKGLSINASPQGQVFYKDGKPSIYEIDMEFVEIDMRTRNYFTGEKVSGSAPPTSGPNR